MNAWDAIEAWAEKHPRIEVISPDRLERSTRKTCPPGELFQALSAMVDETVLEQRYAVQLSNGGLLSDYLYPTPKEVPPQLPGRLDDEVDVRNQRIIPVFCEPSRG